MYNLNDSAQMNLRIKGICRIIAEKANTILPNISYETAKELEKTQKPILSLSVLRQFLGEKEYLSLLNCSKGKDVDMVLNFAAEILIFRIESRDWLKNVTDKMFKGQKISNRVKIAALLNRNVNVSRHRVRFANQNQKER